MPLIKSSSKKAFQKNVETEMDANPGKENKAKNLAIAYSVQRKNKKKMAIGGAVEGPTHTKPFDRDPGTPAPKGHDKALSASEFMSGSMKSAPGSTPSGPMVTISKAEYDALRSGGAYAEGGNVDLEQSMMHGCQMDNRYGDYDDEDPRATSIADAILEKRQKMAEGGILGLDQDHDILEENSEEEPNHEDQESYDALRKENYSEHSALAATDQPEDSNTKGDSEEDESENKHDMISSIRSKMKSKRR